MGVLDRVGKEIERSGHKFDKEVLRPYAREFERIPGLGYLMRNLHESRVAVRSARKAAKQLQHKQRLAQESETLRQSRTAGLIFSERAKLRRMQMAESLVGEEVGLFSTVPVDGPNLSVNKIPSLDPLDDMGNSIPEVI